MHAAREVLRKAFVYSTFAASLFTLVRVVFPELFEAWSDTRLGATLDQIGSSIARWLFQDGSPVVPLMDATQRSVDYVRVQLTTGNLISAIMGALGVGVFNLGYNWVRNVTIRRMCSAMLYFAAWRVLLNAGTIYQAQDDKSETFKLRNSKEVRAALQRVRSEMEALQDFAIAYDYAIWRGLRFFTARLRMRAMLIREALEVIIAEFQLGEYDKDIDFRSGRFSVSAGMADAGYTRLNAIDALGPVLIVTIDLAERLEVGFVRSFLLRWWPASGRSMHSPKLRNTVRDILIKWRHEHWERQKKDKNTWDTQWVASNGALWRSLHPMIHQLVHSVPSASLR